MAARKAVTGPCRILQITMADDPEKTESGIAGSGVAGFPMTDSADGYTQKFGRSLTIQTGVKPSITELPRLDDFEAGPLAATGRQFVRLPIM